jgi:hypothetical protein
VSHLTYGENFTIMAATDYELFIVQLDETLDYYNIVDGGEGKVFNIIDTKDRKQASFIPGLKITGFFTEEEEPLLVLESIDH